MLDDMIKFTSTIYRSIYNLVSSKIQICFIGPPDMLRQGIGLYLFHYLVMLDRFEHISVILFKNRFFYIFVNFF
jgi:hypothetical protein